MADFYGTWPGDETDEELQAQLSEIRGKGDTMTPKPAAPPVPKVPWYKRLLEALNQAAGKDFVSRK